jgi:hypothetical protein
MLEMSPAKRITVEEALIHQYFSSEPLICKEEELPQVREEAHEMDVRNQNEHRSPPRKEIVSSTHNYQNKEKSNLIYNSDSLNSSGGNCLQKKRIIREDN